MAFMRVSIRQLCRMTSAVQCQSPFSKKESKATIRSSKERKRLNLQNQKEDIEGMKMDIGLSAHVVIDLIASCLFPISYIIFNIIYWYMVL